MLGFSLYFDNDKKISHKLKGYQGYDIFFTSLHYPAKDEIYTEFLNLHQKSKELDIKMCVDINNETIINHPELADMEVVLRLDFGFKSEEIATLSKKTEIAINASTVDYKFLKEIEDKGAVMENIIGWHNFYPLEYSGIGEDFFESQNELMRSFDMPIAAFVQGNKDLRGPIYKGLPTLEEDRYKNPYVSIVELSRLYDIPICLIAEGIEETEEKFIKKFFNAGLLTLPVYIKEGYEKLTGMDVRPDMSDYIIRNVRVKRDVKENIPEYIRRGDIVILNNLSDRYSGEIEIIKEDLGISPERNIIGRVDEEFLDLIDYIKGGDYIEFYRK